jgi:hypothetical protein
MRSSGAATTGRVEWFVLAYRVPGEPTRLRATVRRRLKAAGAVHLANSVVALPASPAAEHFFRGLHNEIGGMGGSAQLLRAEAIGGESDLISLFNAARDHEYSQVIEACDDLVAHVVSLQAAGRLTAKDVEEAARKRVELARSNAKVRAADAFGASLAGQAVAALGRCRRAVRGFPGSTARASRVVIRIRPYLEVRTWLTAPTL